MKDIRGKALNFLPQTTEEAVEMQSILFARGFRWSNTGVGIWDPSTCVQKGFYTEGDMQLWCGTKAGYSACHLSDLKEGYKSDRDIMLELLDKFNKVSERLEAVEKKQDRILEHLEPKKLNKQEHKPGGRL